MTKSTSAKLAVSKATLGAALDVSESTVYELVRRGVLAKPINLTPGCVRWSWKAVEDALASLARTTDDSSDPYMEGVRNAAKTAARGQPC